MKTFTRITAALEMKLTAVKVTDFPNERENKERPIPEGNRNCYVCNFTITYNTLLD